MPRRRTPPSQTWRTFLENHVGSTVAIDFFAVPTLTCRILFVFVVLAHDRRRILHVNVTPHPTSAWTQQQLREVFPNNANARFLLHDRDTTFDAAFGRAAEALGLTAVRTAPRSPWQNPYVERVIGSIRRECLDHVIVFNERHLRRVLLGLTSRTTSRFLDAPRARQGCAGGTRRSTRPAATTRVHPSSAACTTATNGKPLNRAWLHWARRPSLDVEVCLRAHSTGISGNKTPPPTLPMALLPGWP